MCVLYCPDSMSAVVAKYVFFLYILCPFLAIFSSCYFLSQLCVMLALLSEAEGILQKPAGGEVNDTQKRLSCSRVYIVAVLRTHSERPANVY